MMKITVVGSGGTGGFFGAKLAKAGEDVTFVARGSHLRAIQDNGLRIKSAVDGDWTVNVKAVESLTGCDKADIVLFCVKSCDTETAAQLVRPILSENTGVLSLQNGVDNEEKLERVLGKKHVIGGVSYVFSNIEAPGVIAHHQLGKILLGEMDNSHSVRTEAFVEACRRASIQAEVVPRIHSTLWEKFVFLAAMAGTTALTRLPVRFIREIPETRQFFMTLIGELLALAKADGAELDDKMTQKCVNFLESLSPTNYSSLYQDLIAGKRLELDALHGHAVRLGYRYGIPTPALFAVYAALLPYENGTPKVV